MEKSIKSRFDEIVKSVASENNEIFELPDSIIDMVSGANDFTQGGNFAQNFSCFAQNIGGFSQGNPPKIPN